MGSLNSALLELCVSPCAPSPLNSCKPEFSHSVWRDRCLFSIKSEIFWALAYRPGKGEFFSSTFEGQNQKGISITAEVRRSLVLFCAVFFSASYEQVWLHREGDWKAVAGQEWWFRCRVPGRRQDTRLT